MNQRNQRRGCRGRDWLRPDHESGFVTEQVHQSGNLHELPRPDVVVPLFRVELSDSGPQVTQSGGVSPEEPIVRLPTCLNLVGKAKKGLVVMTNGAVTTKGLQKRFGVGPDVVTSSTWGGWFSSVQCSVFELQDERFCDMGPPSSAKMFVRNLRACPVGVVGVSMSAEWAQLVSARVR
ncbi:hypothetical protein BHE74_00038975 [Ensete ventricosum]|nr:hypothetical protein BHE74_00038975 [Ensete ventricosum]